MTLIPLKACTFKLLRQNNDECSVTEDCGGSRREYLWESGMSLPVGIKLKYAANSLSNHVDGIFAVQVLPTLTNCIRNHDRLSRSHMALHSHTRNLETRGPFRIPRIVATVMVRLLLHHILHWIRYTSRSLVIRIQAIDFVVDL